MSNTVSRSSQIEALLLYKGGAMKIKELAKTLEVQEADIAEALTTLSQDLNGRGIQLVREGDKVALSTSGEVQGLIERMRRDELEGAVGKAGLETLAVIVYRGPVSRSDIEYIRGVNVSTMLRSLMIRGLVERVENPKDKRSFLYRATAELAAFLGVESLSQLPKYDTYKSELETVSVEGEVVESQS